MSKVWIVAWRDFKSTVMTKAFVLAVIGLPILIVGIGIVAVLIMATHKAPALIGRVAVVDTTGEVAEAARMMFAPEVIQKDREQEARESAEKAGQAIRQGNFTGDMGQFQRGDVRIEVETLPADTDLAALEARVRSGELLAAAVIGSEVLDVPAEAVTDSPSETNGGVDAEEEGGKGEDVSNSPQSSEPSTFVLYVGENLEGSHTSVIEERIGRAIVRVRADRAGVNLHHMNLLMVRPRAATSRLLEAGGESEESEELREVRAFIIPMAFMMLLWISVFSTGQHLLNSTIEEKSNKVMEVLLSAVSPMQLLAGKIIGQGAVGLIILGVYASTGMSALLALSLGGLVPWSQLVYLGVYFFMAYFMVASLMAAVGSAVSDIREANSLLTPVMLVLMMPMILWMPISQAPNGGIATAFSFIPPAIPFVMILRVCADESVPMWQVPVTIAWGYACVIGMVWFASKIFRVGVLMTGKPPTPMELIRWIRYS